MLHAHMLPNKTNIWIMPISSNSRIIINLLLYYDENNDPYFVQSSPFLLDEAMVIVMITSINYNIMTWGVDTAIDNMCHLIISPYSKQKLMLPNNIKRFYINYFNWVNRKIGNFSS